MRLARGLPFALAVLCMAGCGPRAAEDTTSTSAAGLVRLPCRSEANLKAAHSNYCTLDRNWVTPRAHAVMRDVGAKVAAEHPGAVVHYMEASWPSAVRPMPPHLSHGDGRQIDVALFYESIAGTPQPRPPTPSGYYAFEPMREGDVDPCAGAKRPGNNKSPPPDRSWRLDEQRTRTLIQALLADKRVRRLLLEPHLKARLGFANEARIRFPGCNTLRHDGHVYVDVR
ncbi:MAG: hypothetical protein SGJ23_05880 [Alphaproteobacteria bacterium]|nr:hypothetical protein [Alphaproteobacteria bacterium]